MGNNEEKKDTVEKNFASYPDVAADVINVLLYQGKRITEPEKLLGAPTESIYQGYMKLRSQYEDLCKYVIKDGRVSCMYLIANQSRSDGKMLLRKAGYTGGIYREQYEGKMQDIFPVVEIVLYWGDAKWRKGLNSYELFKQRELPREIWKYIDELRLHVFEMRHLPEETRRLFRSDMRIVVDFLAEGEDYYSDRKIVHKAALIKMIKVLSGDGDIDSVENWLEEQGIKEEDEVTVCELFDQYERKGRREGIIAGRREGRIDGERRFARLMQVLMDGGRTADMKRAVSDEDYREQLYMEMNLL